MATNPHLHEHSRSTYIRKRFKPTQALCGACKVLVDVVDFWRKTNNDHLLQLGCEQKHRRYESSPAIVNSKDVPNVVEHEADEQLAA